MDLLTSYAYSKKYSAKTDKSFINIMRGHRSHQTYFDAMMQNLLPFYHTKPDLLTVPVRQNVQPVEFYPYFYDASVMTFQGLRLLTQVFTARQQNYIPVTNHLYIQQQVKSCYSMYTAKSFQETLLTLFDAVYEQYGHCLSALLLPNGDGFHPSPEKVRQKQSLTTSEYDWMLLKELNLLNEYIVRHPDLHPLYIRVPLNSATDITYRAVVKGWSLEQIAAKRRVKLHTIEDHIVEIAIKDYPFQLDHFISAHEIDEIRTLYHLHHFEKLKPYFEASSLDSYLKVKLGLVITMKEVH